MHDAVVDLTAKPHLHCVSKNIPDVFSYNSRKHCRVFIRFGRNITEKVSNQKMLYFSTSPMLLYYLAKLNTRKMYLFT